MFRIWDFWNDELVDLKKKLLQTLKRTKLKGKKLQQKKNLQQKTTHKMKQKSNPFEMVKKVRSLMKRNNRDTK
jgi:hypothetical protein